VLGEHDRSMSDGTEQTRSVDLIIRRPEYKAPTSTSTSLPENDVALLRLAVPVVLGSYVATINLAVGEDGPGLTAIASGWGDTLPDKDGRMLSNVLMEATLPINPNASCNDLYSFGTRLFPNEICAGYPAGDPAGNHGGCKGDSGGPLALQRSNGQWDLIGVVSLGDPRCVSYSVFARTSSHSEWIHNTIDANPPSPPSPANIDSPAPGSMLPGSTVTFSWTAGSGVSQYFLYVGSSVGAADIYGVDQGLGRSATVSGLPLDGRTIFVRLYDLYVGSSLGATDLYVASHGTATSGTVSGLPMDGRAIFVRLWSLTSAGWLFRDRTYTAAPTLAQITSPAPSSRLAGSTVTFSWTTGGGVTFYDLLIGSSLGAADIYNANDGTATSVTVSGLPTDGRTLFVRLWSWTSLGWLYRDFTYTASGVVCDSRNRTHGQMWITEGTYSQYMYNAGWCSVGTSWPASCYFGTYYYYQYLVSDYCSSVGSSGSCYSSDAWWWVTCNSLVDCIYDCSGQCVRSGC
jgi:Trypsin